MDTAIACFALFSTGQVLQNFLLSFGWVSHWLFLVFDAVWPGEIVRPDSSLYLAFGRNFSFFFQCNPPDSGEASLFQASGAENHRLFYARKCCSKAYSGGRPYKAAYFPVGIAVNCLVLTGYRNKKSQTTEIKSKTDRRSAYWKSCVQATYIQKDVKSHWQR